jgi:hypothetical protein
MNIAETILGLVNLRPRDSCLCVYITITLGGRNNNVCDDVKSSVQVVVTSDL